MPIEDRFGYNMNDMKYITVPFADDFNLVTSNKRTHQRLINEIVLLTQQMNMTLKPSKCRSISIVQGTAKEIHYTINDQPIQTVKEKPEKYLGSLVTYYLKSHENFEFIHKKLTTILQNIDSCLIRGEYKLGVVTRYSLPSLRYVLTVHDLTNTQLDQLDSAYSQYVKKWLRFPQRGATPAILYGPDGLKLMLPSDVYKEAHALAYAGSLHHAEEFKMPSNQNFNVNLSGRGKCLKAMLPHARTQ